jgi:arylsulfatase A-like enzyme
MMISIASAAKLAYSYQWRTIEVAHRFPLAAYIAFLAFLAPLTATAATPSRPNIIFILTDDLGYGDLGAFFQNQRQAAKHPDEPAHFTPRLDAMAADGIRLTHHYCPAPVCAPSRASLLLGVHQGHANVRDNQFDKALEDNHTLATVLKQAGYTTAAIGKWGLQGKPTTQPPDWPAHPLKRGFDEYFGYIRHADGHEHYPKEGVHRGAKEVWDNRIEISASLDKCYTADLFTARAKKWIVDHETAKAAQPFFLYLAFDTPHATCELPTQAYPAGSGLKGGLQWLGKPGQMINTASGKVDSWYHPDYANATWDDDHDAATPEKPWPDVYKRYATSVRRIDDAVGDLLQLLKDLKIDDNTLVVFTSDNGPSIESYLKEPYAPTFFGSYGPFDGIKRDCWEGGLRVPTIVRWPASVPAGRTSALPSSFADWMPTFAAVAGIAAPARCDGVSLLPTLTGSGTQATPRVYVEYFVGGSTPRFAQFEPAHRNRLRRQMQALRIGDYIGVRYNIASHADDFEIYNAVTDPKEAHDLGHLADFAKLQQQFKDTVLQVRRPGGDVTRPYDGELVPAVTVADAKPGLAWKSFAGPFPWVPQFDAAEPAAQGVSAQADLSGQPLFKALGSLYTGFIDIPVDGKYTFSLTADSGTLLRLHEATVIDADFGHKLGDQASASILLKAGKHPIRLYYARRSSTAPSLRLEWTGPQITKQVVPATAFSHGTW